MPRSTKRNALIATLACATGALTLTACQGGAETNATNIAEPSVRADQRAGNDGFTSPADAASFAINVGDKAPDFTLPSESGERVRLTNLVNEGPVVVIFYRGEWCPACNGQLREFQQTIDQFEERGATLVAISPQTITGSTKAKQKVKANYRFLSDEGSLVARRYGVSYRVDSETQSALRGYGIDLAAANGVEAWELPLGATYVIDTDGTVRYAYVSDRYQRRAKPKEVLAAIDEINDAS